MPRVLLIDCDTNSRASLAIGLRLDGFIVLEACTHPNARALLEGDPVDLALIDLKVPGHAGLELAREIRVRWSHAAIVVANAYPLPRAQLERAQIRADGFVCKPFVLEEIRGLFRALLVGRTSARAS